MRHTVSTFQRNLILMPLSPAPCLLLELLGFLGRTYANELHVCVCVSVCNAQTPRSKQTHIYVYIYIHMYIYIYVHTHVGSGLTKYI